MISKNLEGKMIAVQFWDHATGLEPVKCKAIGWVNEVTDIFVSLLWWDVMTTNEAMRLHNMESVSILLSTILDIYELEPKKIRKTSKKGKK